MTAEDQPDIAQDPNRNRTSHPNGGGATADTTGHRAQFP